MFLFSMSLTVISNALYHVLQKSIPGAAHPLLSLIATYAMAVVACLALLPLFPFKAGLVQSLRELNWVSYCLGFAIIGLELGFLLAYRAGWNVSLGAIVSNVAVTILLVPIGMLLFREKVSAMNLVGIAVCIIGLVMVNYR
ncbi:MAG: EamA family transporter [Chloroflexi bacterium]|nr:EamA family transporter [Chloroflexota bacterium]